MSFQLGLNDSKKDRNIITAFIQDNQWLSINHTCIYVSGKMANRDGAKKACEKIGLAKLFYIENEKEYDIYKIMRDFIQKRNNEKKNEGTVQYHIGLEYTTSSKKINS
jgi:hypothetical protein